MNVIKKKEKKKKKKYISACGTGTAQPSGAHEITPVFSGFVLLDV